MSIFPCSATVSSRSQTVPGLAPTDAIVSPRSQTVPGLAPADATVPLVVSPSRSGTTSRRGSALLIVLGMLSFLVISAVAFSSYMRATRLPSSYLRRSVASRMLAKAALAEAIDEVDAAIGNFPHPGVWMSDGLSDEANCKSTLTRNTENTNWKYNSNVWLGRVFLGGVTKADRWDSQDEEDLRNDLCNANSASKRASLIPQNMTVPTLTLEGLAYIPPPLVNEARYYSRHSTAGRWHTMPFDAGRYAFCAIDVSDFFDINALTADKARSSDSADRISLAYLFEDASHDQLGSTAKSWDNFISQQLSGNVPLVSLADWNLAMQSSTYGDIKSYFYQFVTQSGTSFYNGEGGSDESADKIRRLSFVTDGWFPGEATTGNANDSVLDLCDATYQPFTQGELQNSNPNYYQITESSSAGSQEILKHVPNLTLAHLYDYLDEDRVPLSLTIPSVERVPMICGLEPQMNGASITVKEEKNPDSGGTDTYPNGEKPVAATRTARRTIVYRLDADAFFGTPSVKALVTYPFRHKDDETVNFTIDGGIALFFTTDSMDLRPRNAVAGLRFTSDDKFQSADIKDNSVILVPFAQKSFAFQQVNNANDAVKEIDLDLMAGLQGVANKLATGSEGILLQVTYEWTQNDTTPEESGGPGAGLWLSYDHPDPTDSGANAQVVDAVCNLRPLKKNGAVDDSFTGNGAALISALEDKTARLNLAVYARVVYNNKTVDLVPACVESDALNGSSNPSMPESQIVLQDNFGSMTPLMRFDTGGNADTGAELKWSVEGLKNAATTPAQVSLYPTAVMVGDPRYNYAPESWFQAGGSLSANGWLTDNGAKGGMGQSDRKDGDIFMATSDQNEMQSVYELAHLPRITNRGFYKNAGKSEAGNLSTPDSYKNTTFAAKDSNDIVNKNFMWRTYDPFLRYENDGVTFEDLNIVSSGSGFKINPYSDATNVMMAAFANTPLDWRCASPNDQVAGSIAAQKLSAKEFNSKYAWNNYSTGGTIDWEDLEMVSRKFMRELRDAKGDDWEDVWADLGWYDDSKIGDEASKYLFGEQLLETSDQGRLYDSDKKFLYGFWHDCFAVKQQLFLIFVRAEPLLMGGGAVHQSPPQLGSRAVALVWRDPINRSTADTSKAYPHRTRVLFYRQFD